MSGSDNVSLGRENYTWFNALLWQNCASHWKDAVSSHSIGGCFAHLSLAFVESIPIIGQIVSIFEAAIATRGEIFVPPRFRKVVVQAPGEDSSPVRLFQSTIVKSKQPFPQQHSDFLFMNNYCLDNVLSKQDDPKLTDDQKQQIVKACEEPFKQFNYNYDQLTESKDLLQNIYDISKELSKNFEEQIQIFPLLLYLNIQTPTDLEQIFEVLNSSERKLILEESKELVASGVMPHIAFIISTAFHKHYNPEHEKDAEENTKIFEELLPLWQAIKNDPSGISFNCDEFNMYDSYQISKVVNIKKIFDLCKTMPHRELVINLLVEAIKRHAFSGLNGFSEINEAFEAFQTLAKNPDSKKSLEAIQNELSRTNLIDFSELIKICRDYSKSSG